MDTSTRFDNEFPTYLESQAQFLEDPEAEGRLEISSSVPLKKYIDPLKLQGRLDRVGELRYEKMHIQFLKMTERFEQGFLDQLGKGEAPVIRVLTKEDHIRVRVEGKKSELPLWKVPIQLQIRDLYNTSVLEDQELDLDALVMEGVRRFQVKNDMLRQSGVRFVEAGTAYRYNFQWHSLLMSVLVGDIGNLLLGTTNLGMAMAFALEPIAYMDYRRVSNPSVRDVENLLLESSDVPIVVTDINAYHMAHLYGHFGDSLIFEWGHDLTGDMGASGAFLPLEVTLR